MGQETARCIARQWSLNPDDPTGETYDHLVMDTWTVWGPSESIEAVRDEIGGDIFTKDDEPPSGVSESDYRAYAESDECSPIAPLPSSGGSTSSAQPTTAPGTSANPEPCVGNCVFSVADVVRDLEGILCKSQDEYAALQGDITDNDRLQTAADQILVCENGGSNDLSSYGIVYLWREFSDMAPALETFSSCDAPGVTAPPANYRVRRQRRQRRQPWLPRGEHSERRAGGLVVDARWSRGSLRALSIYCSVSPNLAPASTLVSGGRDTLQVCVLQ